MVSQPNLFGLPHDRLKNSSPQPKSQLASDFGALLAQPTTFGNSNGFSNSSTRLGQTREALSGTPVSHTPNGFRSSTTKTGQPIFTPFTSSPGRPTHGHTKSLTSRRSAFLASPTPLSRSRSNLSHVGSPEASTTESSPTRVAQSPRSPTKFSGTSSPISHTPVSQPSSNTERGTNAQLSKSFIDPNGDLCLRVGGLFAEDFIVCSKTMARSSPFWQKMLYGEFAEGKKAQSQDTETEWIVKLPEDNPAAMRIILNIIHCRFDQVSGYEDFVYTAHLYNLCILTDKFDMTHILRPWARGWSRSTHSQSDKLGQSLRSKFCHERLWVAWELGDQATFEAMAQALLLNSSSSTGNNLRYIGALEPPEIYESIERVRLDTIKIFLQPFNDLVSSLVGGDALFCKMNSWHSQNNCLALMLGKAIQLLNRNGLWPVPDPATVQESLAEFAMRLQGIGHAEKHATPNDCLHFHLKDLTTGIETALTSIPSLPTETHRRHLEAQARKSGFAPP
ncbi:uncharacterized protein F4822DRAFT_250212 [Hypoxylon trugodes]|uniref:uncharacterized protein n=1 Tax=Hypoxylon trugodes TaxID=326681 RepID=UPI0021A15193|nr:uncharacterized protein F4822DRAFT_250212 [Hypoxylon trugodes]KAI1388562.1 hypothetical protein F4822DRAFT_250212 [Hypoxylon trugodes]